jgi:hypothetical protein
MTKARVLSAICFGLATLYPCDDIEAQGGTTTTAQSKAVSSGTATVFRAAPRAATQELEVISGRAAISINPSLWKETKSTQRNQRMFQHISGDGYAMVITEPIVTTLNQLRERALTDARETDPDLKIVEDKLRRVNGTDLLMLRIEGKVDGIPMAVFGYYYSGLSGTVQVLTCTRPKLFRKYRRDFEDFLNGFHLTLK